MTDERFEELVRRLEKQAAASPTAYKVRVGALAALGFAYIFGILGIALVGVGVVVWSFLEQGRSGWQRRLLEPLAVLIYMIGRSMWIRFPRPEGVELDRADVPVLFDELDAIRREMRAPRYHRVLLDHDVNAWVNQTPRLGMLGWQENTVGIGLPLLQGLSPAQARAVIVHEFGHLSGAHSRFGGWIYRVETAWRRLLEKLEEDDHWASILFRPFFRWYSPYFKAYTFVLRRANEYEADAAAAEFTSARDMADALISVSLKDTFVDHRVWAWVKHQPEVRPEPDVEPYATMARRLPSAPEIEDAKYWLRQFLSQETTLADTHPSLSDRLAAIGEDARVVPAVEESAANVWLGESAARYASQFDESWRERVAEDWRAHHAAVRAKEDRIAELEAKSVAGSLEEDDEWQQAELVEERRGAEQAVPLYLRLAERLPENSYARFHAGRLLLEMGERNGIEHLEASMEKADDAIVPGCDHIVAFLERTDEASAAAPYRERRDTQQAKLAAIQAERDSLPYSATYEPHGLAPEKIQTLIDGLHEQPGVTHAWLTRKKLELSEAPVYVLAVQRRRFDWNPATWSENGEKLDRNLQSRIADQCAFPGETSVLVMNHRPRKAKKAFMAHDAAKLF